MKHRFQVSGGLNAEVGMRNAEMEIAECPLYLFSTFCIPTSEFPKRATVTRSDLPDTSDPLISS